MPRSRGLGAAACTLLGLYSCANSVISDPVPSTAGSDSSGASPSAGAAPGGTGGEPSNPFGTSGSGGASTGGSGGAIAGGGAMAGGGAIAGSTSAGASAGGGAGAGTGGSAVVGAGGDGGASTGGSAGTSAVGGCPGLFCEDFERGSLDPSVWSSQVNGGQTAGAVQSAVVAHGKYAVQFHAKPSVQSYDLIITKNAPAALQGHHFGRAYFNVTPKPPAQHTQFLFAGSAGFPKVKYLEVAGIGAGWQLTFVDQVGGGESYASGGNAPQARWVCLEWEFNDSPDQATVFVDGVQSYSRPSITFMGKSSGLVGGFADFGFGYYAWHPASYPFDIYFDDIVLDTKRVGCLPAP